MWTLAFAMVLGQVPGPQSPADALAAIHKDLERLPADARIYIRYASNYAAPQPERAKDIAVLNGHINGTSRETFLKRAYEVPGTQQSLVRIDLRLYGWKPEVWERLQPPYFTETVEDYETLTWEGGVWPGDGKFYQRGSFKYQRPKQSGFARWLSDTPEQRQQLADIYAWTQSRAFVVRLDWFVSETATQEGRNVGYYDLLGIKTQADFEKAVRFNAEIASKLEHLRTVTFSGITLEPRLIEVFPTVLGHRWATYDNAEATGRRNPLVVLGRVKEFDATEQFAPLLNGMPAWYLGNDKGQAQDKAPDNVVGGYVRPVVLMDGQTFHSNDRRLEVNLACIGCHFSAKGENGVKDIDFAKIRKLKALDFAKTLELERQYLRNLKPLVDQSRIGFAAAIEEATGLEAHEYAKAYVRLVSRYRDIRVDAAKAAADMGMPKDSMLQAFRAYDGATDLLNPLLSIIEQGGSIPVRQWEEVFPTAMMTARSVKVEDK